MFFTAVYPQNFVPHRTAPPKADFLHSLHPLHMESLWPLFYALYALFAQHSLHPLHTLFIPFSLFSFFSLFSHTTAPTFSLFSHTTTPTPSFSLLHTPLFSPASSASAFLLFPPVLHFSRYVCMLILIDFSCSFECCCFVLNLLRK